ncbi:endonuclease III [Planctomycetota bacterium]|nr:endonuclease III [Planctomycetota bacterium]
MSADPAVVAAALDRHWPDASCELFARDAWELLVAAILSARATDTQVNKVMAVLNERLVGPAAYAVLAPRELVKPLRSLPLYPQKARAVVEAARAVLRRHNGQVPRQRAALATLPGVGPKTAAVVVGNAFAVPAIAADTHVMRLSHRLGWANREHPREAETALVDRFPPERWVKLCHQLIRCGREFCRRQNPRCAGCPLALTCPRQGLQRAGSIPTSTVPS